jgi:imidazolonepropionase-like amidohydrolase/ABC-type multidrug transport system permease subunit
MIQLRGLGALSWAYLLEASRSKAAVFWNLVFPLFTLIGFSYIFGGGEPVPVARVVPGIMTINLLAAAFFGISMHMVTLREKDLYRRFWATPLTPLTVVLAHSVTALVNMLVSVVLQLAVALALFHISLHGSAVTLAIAVLLGAFAFIPLGLLVGSVAQNTKTAPAISNLLFFPLSFLSGAAMPLYFMPVWIQRLATLLPSTYLVELLQDVMLRGYGLREIAIPAGILALTGIAGFAFNVWLFRWESAQPINRRGLVLTVASLAIIYGAVFVHGMNLESARAPEQRNSGRFKLTSDTRILRGMTILDGLGGRIEHGEVVLEGNRIVDVGPADGSIPKGVPVTDFSGLYMIPGLIDSHIHLGGSGGGSSSPEEFAPSRVVRDTQVFLALGITSFLSLADNVEDLQRLKQDVASGAMRAPRPFLSGPVITAPGGHPAKLFSFMPGLAEYMTRQVDSPAAAEKAVRELAAMHVDIVKLYLEEGWPGQSFPVLSQPCLQAAIRTAKELGLRTTVHVDNDEHARMAIEAGADGIEHVPPDLTDQTIQRMVNKGVTLTPTLVESEGLAMAMSGVPVTDPLVQKWENPSIVASLQSPDSWIARSRQSKETVDYYVQRFERAKNALRRAVAAHVIVLAGSDSGNPGSFHGPGLLRELDLLVEQGGMTPSAAIVSATSAAARRLGQSDIGRIAPGAFADLVVLDADPTRDIRAVSAVRAVYLGGVPLDRDSLLSKRPGNWSPLFSYPAPSKQ